ncbi:MAG: 4a-hydroxytetrahydrobiopterin dehydratase [Mangrovicoccus sp.]
MPLLPLDDARLAALFDAGWQLSEAKTEISKSYKFADFSAAFAWMTRAALAAEKLDHHPDWRNVYNRVEVTLTTHDASGLTEKDLKLAAYLENF